MLRRITSLVIQRRGLKDDIKVKWVKPDYVPSHKPQHSGDLEAAPKISDQTLALDYAQKNELKDVPEEVMKLFTVGFLGRQERNALVKNEMMDRVRRHKYDSGANETIETRIARLTGHIRCLQVCLEEFPQNSKAKITVNELIAKRKKLLKEMRKYDYKMFEWLLEKLNIVYKNYPEIPKRKTRKESLRLLTDMYCDDIKNKKLADYRNLLESQQGPFLRQKLDALKFIRKEQEELQLPITVNHQEIQTVEKQLEEWTVKDEMKKQAKKKKKILVID